MNNQLNVTVDTVIKKVIDAVKSAIRATDAARRVTEEIEALRTSELNSRNKTIKEAAAATKANTAAEEAAKAASDTIRAASDATRVKDAIFSKITTLEEQLKQKEQLAKKAHEAKEAAIKALRAAEDVALLEKNKFNGLNIKNNKSSYALLAARRNMPIYIKKVEALTDAANKVDKNLQQLFDRIVVLYELDKVVFEKVSEAKEAARIASEEAKVASAAAMKAMIHVREVLNANAARAAARAETAKADAAKAEIERAAALAVAKKEEEAELVKKSTIDEFKNKVIDDYTRFVVNNNHSLKNMRDFLNAYFIKEELLPYEISGVPDNWNNIFKDTGNELYRALRKAAAFSHPDRINMLGLDDELLGILHGVNISLSLYMTHMKNSGQAGGTRRKQHINKGLLYKRIYTCKNNKRSKRSNRTYRR